MPGSSVDGMKDLFADMEAAHTEDSKAEEEEEKKEAA